MDLKLAPPQPFEALIFDCDGTLVDSAGLHFEGLSTALRNAGVDFTREWYLDRVGLSRAEFFDAVRTQFDVDVDEETVVAAHDAHFHALVHTLTPITAVVDVIRAFAGRVPLAVASGGRRRQVEASIEAVGLRPLFDAVVALEDVEHGKPRPDLFLEAARRLDVSPGACVVYDDSPEGLQAATRAGMRSVHVRIAR